MQTNRVDEHSANLTNIYIDARHISKSVGSGRGRSEVLKDVSFHVKQHEMVAIMGRSGSGKTTLLNCVAGLDNPTQGDALLCGKSVTHMNLKQRAQLRRSELGFVFQQYQLIPYLTVAQNVALPLDLAHHKPSKQQILAALDAVGLSQLATQKTANLSGGEQQRVALARTLIQQPTITLADEPTGALDSASVHMVMHLLRSLTRNGCVLLVTHDAQVAAQCDRILMLQDGHILQELRQPTSAKDIDYYLTNMLKSNESECANSYEF